MLGRGEWHKVVPREYWANLEFRKWLIESCRNNRENQQAVIEGCRHDFLFFINVFCLQYNPLLNKDGRGIGPFITYEFQEKALLQDHGILWTYEENRTAVIEKSREMGASWLFLIFQVWLCAFHDNVQCLNISRSAEAVDSASRNSLFSKIRYLIEHCPRWLLGSVEDQKFLFKFKRSASEISGEASTGRAGTGGRASVIFVDEFPEIREAEKVRQNTANVAECRFFNGSHLGVGTQFYQMTKESSCVQIQMHWTRHPRKNSHLYSWDVDAGKPRFWKYLAESDELVETKHPVNPFPEDYAYDRSGNPSGGPHPGIRSVWYDTKSLAIGTVRQVAMELDINPTGSSSQFYEALMIKQLTLKCRDEFWRGDLNFDHDSARPNELVPGTGPDDVLQLWLHPGLDSNGRLSHVTPSSYIIGGDLGTGIGSSPSCLSIFDAIRGLKVGMYTHNRRDEKHMALLAVSLCRLFKDHDGESAYLIWETPGPGNAFGQIVLKELEFRNIYYRITNIIGREEKQSETPGYHANPASKELLHREYQFALKSGKYVNWDKPALLETLGYVHGPAGGVEHPKAKKNSDAAAAGTNHGDHVVADALTWQMAKKRGGSDVEIKNEVVLAIPNSIAGRREYNRLRERRPIWS